MPRALEPRRKTTPGRSVVTDGVSDGVRWRELSQWTSRPEGWKRSVKVDNPPSDHTYSYSLHLP